jgi:peptide chain release factor-like protein
MRESGQRSGPHPASLEPEELRRQCVESRSRRSGPGGQHRNKVETAVSLMHQPTGVQAEANERRSQAENRRVALFRLRLKLAVQVRTKCDPATTPSELWKSRCRAGRLAVNPNHADFPVILAEALNVLVLNDFDTGSAATALGCSASQLVKLLKDEPRAFELFNRERTARSRPRLS